uniref:Uncharacterized protein n=1 Tax=Knipowitschia caucasica TaxID=637954 RepID=A0AAV2M6J8_KNICA
MMRLTQRSKVEEGQVGLLRPRPVCPPSSLYFFCLSLSCVPLLPLSQSVLCPCTSSVSVCPVSLYFFCLSLSCVPVLPLSHLSCVPVLPLSQSPVPVLPLSPPVMIHKPEPPPEMRHEPCAAGRERSIAFNRNQIIF